MIDFENKNHYELLGLERDASTEEIKQAFKDIALVYHPDSNFFDEILDEIELPPDDSKLFKAITQAYNILSNQEKREAYDKSLTKKDISEGFNATGEWVRPDGTTPSEVRKVRERAPTITNLQKLQKQYEETVKSQVNVKPTRVATVAELRQGRDGEGEKINKLLLFALIAVSAFILLIIIILL